jgi:hypothetical protein
MYGIRGVRSGRSCAPPFWEGHGGRERGSSGRGETECLTDLPESARPDMCRPAVFVINTTSHTDTKISRHSRVLSSRARASRAGCSWLEKNREQQSSRDGGIRDPDPLAIGAGVGGSCRSIPSRADPLRSSSNLCCSAAPCSSPGFVGTPQLPDNAVALLLLFSPVLLEFFSATTCHPGHQTSEGRHPTSQETECQRLNPSAL